MVIHRRVRRRRPGRDRDHRSKGFDRTRERVIELECHIVDFLVESPSHRIDVPARRRDPREEAQARAAVPEGLPSDIRWPRRRSGEVDDDGTRGNTGHRAGEPGVCGRGRGAAPHQFDQTIGAALDHLQGCFGRNVARGTSVPPVVTTRAQRLRTQKRRRRTIAARSSGMIRRSTTSYPASRRMRSSSGPERSSRPPRDERSLIVSTAAFMRGSTVK